MDYAGYDLKDGETGAALALDEEAAEDLGEHFAFVGTHAWAGTSGEHAGHLDGCPLFGDPEAGSRGGSDAGENIGHEDELRLPELAAVDTHEIGVALLREIHYGAVFLCHVRVMMMD